jgi:hypothetical protein
MSKNQGRPAGYQGSHRDATAQAGRWFPLVIYAVGLGAIAAMLSGWWH